MKKALFTPSQKSSITSKLEPHVEDIFKKLLRIQELCDSRVNVEASLNSIKEHTNHLVGVFEYVKKP